MRKIFHSVVVIATMFITLCTYAQENKAAISGYVKDARTKQPLIEAVVTLTSNRFEGQKLALTDSTGIYSVKNLPAGIYSISFEMEGYRKFTQDSIVLKNGMSLGVSFQMAKERKTKRTDTTEKLDVTGNH